MPPLLLHYIYSFYHPYPAIDVWSTMQRRDVFCFLAKKWKQPTAFFQLQDSRLRYRVLTTVMVASEEPLSPWSFWKDTSRKSLLYCSLYLRSATCSNGCSKHYRGTTIWQHPHVVLFFVLPLLQSIVSRWCSHFWMDFQLSMTLEEFNFLKQSNLLWLVYYVLQKNPYFSRNAICQITRWANGVYRVDWRLFSRVFKKMRYCVFFTRLCFDR